MNDHVRIGDPAVRLNPEEEKHDRGIQLGATLLEDLNDMDFGKIIPPVVIAEKWKERNDARAHILIGDPAARIRAKDIK